MTQPEEADIFEVLDIAIVETGALDHRVRRANAAACALSGSTPDELIGRSWGGSCFQADHARMDAQARMYLAQGQGRTRRLIRLRHRNGATIHAVATSVLRTDADGEPYFLTHLQNVSEEIAAQDQLRLVVENTPVSMFLLDRDGHVLVSAGSATPQTAAGLREARELSILRIFADQPQVTSAVRRALAGERVDQMIETFGRCLDLHLVPIPDPNGQVGSVAAVATDITEWQQALADLRLRSAEQATVADLGQSALEAREPAALWNQAVLALADQLRADLVEIHDLDAQEGRSALLARADRRREPASERTDTPRPDVRLTVPIGRPTSPLAKIEIHRQPGAAPFTEQDQRFARSVAAVLGSAALRFRMEDEIRYRSLHDGLTGLPNRTALLDHLEQALRQPRQTDRRIGVLFIDLDGFKKVNDTLGHEAGDRLLRATAARLNTAVRPGDVVGRLAGDEFAVVCEDIPSIADLEAIADRVLAAIATPCRLFEQSTVSTGSIGMALSDRDLHDADALLNAADLAMYTAKRHQPGSRLAYRRPGHGGRAVQRSG